MARIWNVRLNVDALNAAVAGLESDTERLAFFAGFHGGLNGKQKSDKSDPWIAGWGIANECITEALAFSEKQRERVNKRYHGTTAVEPRNNHGTTVELPIQQSTIYNLQSTNDNPKIEREREALRPPRHARHVIPPTKAMVEAYCEERNNSIDADKFLNRYEANGWLVGKSKMKDWQAAIRTWEGNGFNGPIKPKDDHYDHYDHYGEEGESLPTNLSDLPDGHPLKPIKKKAQTIP